jgi:hypothetical protein
MLVTRVTRAEDNGTIKAEPQQALTTAPIAPASDTPAGDHTLLGGRTSHGGYGGPEMKVTTMTGEAAILVGGQAGWIINRHLLLGGAGYGLATSHSPTPDLARPEGPSRLGLGYGGLRLGWIFATENLVHLTAAVLVGAGGVTVATHNLSADRWDTHNSEAFFALEPQVELELNLARYVRLALSGSYRYIGNTGTAGLQASDLSGPAGGVIAKFGVF